MRPRQSPTQAPGSGAVARLGPRSEGLAVDQPDDVLRPLRYSPLAPALTLTLRGMTLSSQTAIVQKRLAHLVRTQALVRRLDRAIDVPGDANAGAYRRAT